MPQKINSIIIETKIAWKTFVRSEKKHATAKSILKKKRSLTYEENPLYHKQNTYYICKNEFGTYDDYAGQYKSAAHNIFNLRYKTPI